MSHQDRVEQRQLADQWAHRPVTIEVPQATRRQRLKNFAEGYGVGWFLVSIARSIKD
jgi:hypothetical protein